MVIACQITGLARIQLHKLQTQLIGIGLKLYYSDTDSVYAGPESDDPEEIKRLEIELAKLNSNKLGESKSEIYETFNKYFVEGVFVAPKMYSLRDENKTKIVCKGIKDCLLDKTFDSEKKKNNILNQREQNNIKQNDLVTFDRLLKLVNEGQTINVPNVLTTVRRKNEIQNFESEQHILKNIKIEKEIDGKLDKGTLWYNEKYDYWEIDPKVINKELDIDINTKDILKQYKTEDEIISEYGQDVYNHYYVYLEDSEYILTNNCDNYIKSTNKTVLTQITGLYTQLSFKINYNCKIDNIDMSIKVFIKMIQHIHGINSMNPIIKMSDNEINISFPNTKINKTKFKILLSNINRSYQIISKRATEQSSKTNIQLNSKIIQ